MTSGMTPTLFIYFRSFSFQTSAYSYKYEHTPKMGAIYATYDFDKFVFKWI